jgi:hypothetical protein
MYFQNRKALGFGPLLGEASKRRERREASNPHRSTANGHPPVLSFCSLAFVASAAVAPFPIKVFGPVSGTKKPLG